MWRKFLGGGAFGSPNNRGGRSRPSHGYSRTRLDGPLRYAEALETRHMLASVALVTETTTARAFVPSSGQDIVDLGLDWTGSDPAFDDSAWTPTVGPSGVGYDANAGSTKYDAFFGLDVETSMRSKSATALVRIPFTVSNAELFTELRLNIRFDDGFVAWINGVEVMRQNAPTGYPLNITGSGSRATGAPADVVSQTLAPFDISAHLNTVVNGSNVLAIRGYNAVESQADFLIQATLEVEFPNAPPTANDDYVATSTETPVIVDVLDNDADGEDSIDPTTVQITRQPADGTVSVDPASGTVTYTPNHEFRGLDKFTYRVQDDSSPAHSLTVVSPTTTPHRTLVPTNNDLGLTWTGGNEPFNDSAWIAGVGGIGYDADLSVSFLPYIDDNVGPRMYQMSPGIYERIPFTAPAAQPEAFRLIARVDDGFVAYINGVRVAELFAPTNLAYNSVAIGSTSDSSSLNPREFIIPLAGIQLRPGANQNILAIHLLNQSSGNSDLLMQAELIADIPSASRWSNEATVTLSVTGLGPIAIPDQVQTIGRIPVTIAVLNNDAEGDPPNNFPLRPETVRVRTVPANGTATVDSATGAITYEANPGFFGDDTFEYTVRDTAPVGGDLEAVALLPRGATWRYLDNGSNLGASWVGVDFDDSGWSAGPAKLGYGTNAATVVNYGPNSNSKFITTYFRTTFEVEDPATVSALDIVGDYDDGIVVYLNGTEVARGSLPAGPIHYLTLASVHNGGAFQTISALTADQLSVLRSGTNVIAVEIHQTAPDSSDISMDVELTATIRAPIGRASSVGRVTVAVASTNEPPLANDDDALTKVNRPVQVDVLLNDQPDGAPIDPTTVTIVSGPANGAVSVSASGNVAYTPAVAFFGDDSFSYMVRDTAGRTSNIATVSIDVVRSIPLPADDLYYVDEDDVLNVSAALGLISNDSDDGGVIVAATVLEPPEHGAVSLEADGSFRYVPTANFFGDDRFTYRIIDNHDETAEASVIVRVLPSPDAPIAVDDEFEATLGTSLVVLAAPLERRNLIPAGADWKYLDDGSSQGSSWRAVDFDDSAWPSGVAQFGYGDGDEATVVRYGDDLYVRHVTTYFRRDIFLTTTASFDSVRLGLLRDDGAAVYVNNQRVVLSNLPASINNQTFAERAVAGDDENEFYEFEFSPAGFLPGRNVVAVEVHQASQFSNDLSFDLFMDVDLVGERDNGVLANDVDVDGEVLSASLVSSPRYGTLTFLADGGFTYTPNPGFVGVDTFTYRATDGALQSNVASVTIQVNPLSTLTADFNDDAQVNAADLSIVASGLGTSSGAVKASGDANGDGRVDLQDLLAVQRSFGDGAISIPSAPATVVARAGERPLVQLELQPRELRAERRHRRAHSESSQLSLSTVDRALANIHELTSNLSARRLRARVRG